MQLEKFKQKSERPSQLELKSLDVKGREIAGLEPRMERFSRLPKEALVQDVFNDIVDTDLNAENCLLFVNPDQGDSEYLVEPPHWRSITGEGIRADVLVNENRETYYSWNTKGCGYLKPSVKGGYPLTHYRKWNRIDEVGSQGAYGLASREEFFHDADNTSIVDRTNMFVDMGVRTELYWYIGKLKQLYYQGQLVDVDSLKKRGVLPDIEYFKPTIGVRFMKTNTRIAEVAKHDEEYALSLFRHAYMIYNQETQDKELKREKIRLNSVDGDRQFYLDFASHMALNLARLFNNGYAAWHLHSANITLAAEIVDVGSIMHWQYDGDDSNIRYNGLRKSTIKDMRDTAYSLKILYNAGKRLGLYIPKRDEFAMHFLEVFASELDDPLLRNQDADKSDYLDVVERIYNAALIKNQRLGALTRGFDISDWPISLTIDS